MDRSITDLSRKLPIGVQTFEKIRKENYLYVDKTSLMWQIANTGTVYFLSRPRRFGKSLLLSTFESYFLGRKDLFKGLAIENLETEWNTYPVLYLDLNAEKYESVEYLQWLIETFLAQWEKIYGTDESEKTLSSRFSGIIRRAYEQTGQGVVVLIDEYDKPLLQTMFDEPLAEKYRSTLKAFYAVLKSSDRYLRFVLLTGVTKFSHVSIFSDLNQLNDISMDMRYSAVCGITEEELVTTFTPEIEQIGKNNNLLFDETVAHMKAQYDGYHFSEDSPGMFNPFSVLNSFYKLKFDNYWFQTGTPTFLVELLKRSDYDLRELIDGIEMSSRAFTLYRAESNNPIPVFYQSGYLTIKGYDQEFGLYKLGFPNNEVRYAFLEFLIPYYTKITDDETDFNITRFVQELRAGKVDDFMERLRCFFADIPYELNDRTERHYHTVFYLVFTLMGQFVESEVRSSRGRADAVVKTKDRIYVFEFKLNGTAEEALRQIDEKGYLIPYLVDGRQVVKVGVRFDAETRNIGEWVKIYEL